MLSSSGLRAGDLLPRATAADKPLRFLLKSPVVSPTSSPKKATLLPRLLPRLDGVPFRPHWGERSAARPTLLLVHVRPLPGVPQGRVLPERNACEYAHGVFECWHHPAQYRTRLCKDQVGCAGRICFFAHKPEVLRAVNPSAASVGMSPVSSPHSSLAPMTLSRGKGLNLDMYCRRRLLCLLQNIRLSPSPRLAAMPPSRSFRIATAAAAVASASTSGSANDGSFSYWWNHRWISAIGAILVGQAAVFLGLSNNSVLAQADSVGQPATEREQAEANVTGLYRIEDGSVISNEHTIKWRIFTDNARDFFLKGKQDEAEKFFQSALHEAKEGFGLRDPHVASSLNNLAEFYRLRKEYEKAEPLYLEAIEILEESFGPDDIRVGAALHNLGQYYHVQLKLDRARACYERALKIEGRVLGLGHPDYANTMYLLAKVLRLQKEDKDSEALIQESIRILEEAGLGESPICIQRMNSLSWDFVRTRRLAEAENWQRKILHNLELSKGWNSLDTTMAAKVLALTLQTLGKLEESEELLERCLAVNRKILSEDHVQVADSLLDLARVALLKFNAQKTENSNQARSELVKAKQLLNNSIRITEGIISPSRKDQNRFASASPDKYQFMAMSVLLQSLEAVGLLEIARHQTFVPGLVLLLRLPLEPMKHGYFKIDAVSVSDTCRLYMWSNMQPIDVRYTTLRIHFKYKFEKEQFEYQEAEQALSKCVSLFKEPHTRSLVLRDRQRYISCLRRLSTIVQINTVKSQRMKAQGLLNDVQQVLSELGERNKT